MLGDRRSFTWFGYFGDIGVLNLIEEKREKKIGSRTRYVRKINRLKQKEKRWTIYL